MPARIILNIYKPAQMDTSTPDILHKLENLIAHNFWQAKESELVLMAEGLLRYPSIQSLSCLLAKNRHKQTFAGSVKLPCPIRAVYSG